MKKQQAIEYWEIVGNPENDVYVRLVKTLCTHSDRFYFITRKELHYNPEIFVAFTPYIIETYQTKSWAGTETTGPAATVYIIESNEETCALLIEHANHLYDWVAPALPEDITFIKNDFVWFQSTTHEEYATFSIRSQYYKKLMTNIEGLVLEQVIDEM
ncbi:MAG TPA: hypothetical protein VK120_10470 [Sporosarcina sp.]|nr:hypothetical protein [Sporosarcina sp.]